MLLALDRERFVRWIVVPGYLGGSDVSIALIALYINASGFDLGFNRRPQFGCDAVKDDWVAHDRNFSALLRSTHSEIRRRWAHRYPLRVYPAGGLRWHCDFGLLRRRLRLTCFDAVRNHTPAIMPQPFRAMDNARSAPKYQSYDAGEYDYVSR